MNSKLSYFLDGMASAFMLYPMVNIKPVQVVNTNIYSGSASTARHWTKVGIMISNDTEKTMKAVEKTHPHVKFNYECVRTT